MNTVAAIVLIVGYIGTLAGVLSAVVNIFRKLKEIIDGQLCELRSDITAIYYRHVDEEEPTLREYERQNLDALYHGYTALGGNHFIKDIYEKMRGWKVTT